MGPTATGFFLYIVSYHKGNPIIKIFRNFHTLIHNFVFLFPGIIFQIFLGILFMEFSVQNIQSVFLFPSRFPFHELGFGAITNNSTTAVSPTKQPQTDLPNPALPITEVRVQIMQIRLIKFLITLLHVEIKFVKINHMHG